MAAITTFRMDASRLNASIKSAFPKSVTLARADAQQRLHNQSKSGVRSKVVDDGRAMLIGTGLAATFEHGRQGGYEINPGAITGIRRSFSRKTGTATYKARAGSGDKVALKFTGGDGGFAAHAIGGDMKAYPALAPASVDWVQRIYPQVAKASLSAAGFSLASAVRRG